MNELKKEMIEKLTMISNGANDMIKSLINENYDEDELEMMNENDLFR